MAKSPFVGDVVIDVTKLKQIQRMLDVNTDRFVAELATDTVRDIKQSFGTSPAPDGGPPGVDTGNLRASIQIDKMDNAKYRVFTDVDYAPWLEFGTYRGGKLWMWPFFLPAVMRTVRKVNQNGRAARVVTGG